MRRRDASRFSDDPVPLACERCGQPHPVRRASQRCPPPGVYEPVPEDATRGERFRLLLQRFAYYWEHGA